jgi:hypothetical protein
LGGKVIAGKKDYGPETLTIVNQSAIFENLPKNFTFWSLMAINIFLKKLKGITDPEKN